MRSHQLRHRVGLLSLLIVCGVLFASTAKAGSVFTYQGQLQLEGQPLTTDCTFVFSLWDAASEGSPQGDPLELTDVVVTNGLFTVQLDFGSDALGSGGRWLETAVGCSGGPTLSTLSPRQPLTAAPYAHFADRVAASAVGSSQIAPNAVTSVKIADGTITAADVDASSLQRRVTGVCAADTAMTYINEDGTIGCASTGGLWLPYSDSASESSPLLSLSNTGSGIGVRGSSDTGRGVLGQSGSSTGVSGLSASGSGVEGVSTSGIGVWGRAAGASAVPPTFLFLPVSPGVYGNGDASPGVMGSSVSAGGVLGTSVSSSGVAGVSTGSGDGVTGVSTTAGVGVRGTSTNGFGVYGETGAVCDGCEDYAPAGVTGVSTAVQGVGLRGKATGVNGYGIIGTSTQGTAIFGRATGGYPAIQGKSLGMNGIGVRGEALEGSGGHGVFGTSANGTGVGGYGRPGVSGENGASDNKGYLATDAAGVKGESPVGIGVHGVTWAGSTDSEELAGVVGEAPNLNGIGVRGVADTGEYSVGIYGKSLNGHAGLFLGDVKIVGDVEINGTVSKAGGSFKIDHPLDPANKYLSHSFVESPDMMNVYNGNVVLDDAGEAVVELPAWFEALNRDFRYQLSCIGSHAPVYVAEKIHDNRFRIGGGTPGLEVSWQITGIRQDAFAKVHPIIVEEDKPAEEKGLYLHPVELGQPASLSVLNSKGGAK